MRSFVHAALVSRPRSRGLAFLGLLTGGLIGRWAYGAAEAFSARLALMDVGTRVYKDAQWASATSGMALAAGLACVTLWLCGSSLRSAFGLPPGRPLNVGFTAIRVVVALPLLLWIALWSSDEFFARRSTAAPFKALAVGLVLCAMFVYDVPRLFGNAVAALRTRIPLWRAATPLAELPATGRVRTRGTIRLDDPHASQAVYRRDGETVSCLPFFLESGSTRVHVELDPSRALVETVMNPIDDSSALHAGAEVEVVADVTRPGGGDAYRGGAPRLVAGAGGLYVFVSGARANRRLVLAAAVELLCALALAGVVVGLATFWVMLGARA